MAALHHIYLYMYTDIYIYITCTREAQSAQALVPELLNSRGSLPQGFPESLNSGILERLYRVLGLWL